MRSAAPRRYEKETAMRQLKIGTSWVRGVVGDALTPDLMVNFSCAFGTWCDGGTVVVGRDTRRSARMLHAATLSGLASTGCQMIDLGVCSTPLVSFLVRERKAAGGISLTGSHNDARWNAMKFLGPDGALLNAVKSEELLDIYHASDYLLATWDGLRKPQGDDTALDRYVDWLLTLLDADRIRERGLKIAIDYCNGTCSAPGAKLLEALGCTVYPLNEEPRGEFAHPPAPTAENMRQLATLMRSLHADIGAEINIDGDHVGFVTADGVPLSEEYALPLAAQNLLARRAGPVVTTLSTSLMVDAVASEYRQPVVRTQVGEGYVVDRGLMDGASVAGEGSGGVAALPESTTFDALLTLGLVLEQMAITGKGLAGLVASLPPCEMRKGELSAPPDVVYQILDGVRKKYTDQSPDTSDGVRIDWGDAWLHVRASNTEPLFRVIVEAATKERADSLFEEAMTHARRIAFGVAHS